MHCATYNHSLFIENTLSGFVNQQTDFPFVCVIVDDASTDNTSEIIRKYVARYFVEIDNLCKTDNSDYVLGLYHHKINPNCYFAVYYLKYNHFGKGIRKELYYKFFNERSRFIAFCEGDDYWIDPMKLQKQVEILNRDSTVTMVYSSFNTVDVCGDIISVPLYNRHINISRSGDILPRLLKNNYIMTLTTMFRKEIFDDQLYENSPKKYDYTYFLLAASLGNVVYINEKTGCYRVTSTGAVATRNIRIQYNRNRVSKYFSHEYLRHNIDVVPKNKTALYTSIVMCNMDNITDLTNALKLKKSLMLYLPLAFFAKIIDSIMYRLKMNCDSYSLLFHI